MLDICTWKFRDHVTWSFLCDLSASNNMQISCFISFEFAFCSTNVWNAYQGVGFYTIYPTERHRHEVFKKHRNQTNVCIKLSCIPRATGHI